MKFNITSFQFDSNYLFDILHKLDSYLSQRISDELSDLDSGFDLTFSISCYSDNSDQLILKDQIRGRKKPKVITQFLSFPHNNLEFRDDWVFELKVFDFKRKKNAYRTYPLDKYVTLVIQSLKQFFQNEKVDITLNFKQLEQDLIEHINQNKIAFTFKNEELMLLEELINGTHYSYAEAEGQAWQESGIGLKWIKLRDKYHFNSNGQLIEK